MQMQRWYSRESLCLDNGAVIAFILLILKKCLNDITFTIEKNKHDNTYW